MEVKSQELDAAPLTVHPNSYLDRCARVRVTDVSDPLSTPGVRLIRSGRSSTVSRPNEVPRLNPPPSKESRDVLFHDFPLFTMTPSSQWKLEATL